MYKRQAEGYEKLDITNLDAVSYTHLGDAAYAGGNVYCATKAAVKAITDGLRIDVAHTNVRVTNVKPDVYKRQGKP